jgi:hypothetical protein
MAQRTDEGFGRTSSGHGQRARDDMTDETLGGNPGAREVGPGIISSDPAELGMGAGDPGYTAEENDAGTQKSRRPARKRAKR